MERIMADLIDQGVSEDRAYDLASERAYPAMRERLADLIDDIRLRKKESCNVRFEERSREFSFMARLIFFKE